MDGYTQYYSKYHLPGYELYRESSFFAPITEPPGERDSRLPFLESAIMKLMLTKLPQRVPLISMLFSPGMLFWLLLGSLACCNEGEGTGGERDASFHAFDCAGLLCRADCPGTVLPDFILRASCDAYIASGGVLC